MAFTMEFEKFSNYCELKYTYNQFWSRYISACMHGMVTTLSSRYASINLHEMVQSKVCFE